ncbi:MAG: hypothetical protein WBS21_05010, partial [Candidatus Acidiferrum sp.]
MRHRPTFSPVELSVNAGRRALSSAKSVHAHYNAAGIGFIVAELELGLTFCQTAVNTNSRQDAQRRIQNAFTAYSAAVRYAQKVTLTADERRDFNDKESRLR